MKFLTKTVNIFITEISKNKFESFIDDHLYKNDSGNSKSANKAKKHSKNNHAQTQNQPPKIPVVKHTEQSRNTENNNQKPIKTIPALRFNIFILRKRFKFYD